MADNSMRQPLVLVQIPSFEGLARPGIYFLHHCGAVIYVGQAVDVRRRLGQHISEGAKIFDAISFLPCSREALNKLERRYIESLRPKYNHCAFSKVLRAEGWEPQAAPSPAGRRPRSKVRRSAPLVTPQAE